VEGFVLTGLNIRIVIAEHNLTGKQNLGEIGFWDTGRMKIAGDYFHCLAVVRIFEVFNIHVPLQ
jgi:hypothetical protein